MRTKGALVGLVLVLAGCSWSRDTTLSDRPRTTEKPTRSRHRICAYPSLRPRYLPWRESGGIPDPTRTYDFQIDRAALVWTDPSNPKQGLALTVYPLDEPSSTEKPIGVIIEGAKGYLHLGSVGEHVVWWDLEDRHCNFLELSLSLGVRAREIDRELIKVARSLRRRG